MGANRVARYLLPRNDFLPCPAKIVDPQFNDIARLQILLRPHTQTNSSWGSGADDIAGQQRHELANVTDEGGNTKNHFAGGASLPEGSVNLQPHSQMPRIRNLITGRQEWSQWGERIGTLSLHP